jgi:hypothetical protein
MVIHLNQERGKTRFFYASELKDVGAVVLRFKGLRAFQH